MGVSVLRGQGVGLPTVKVSFWPGVRNRAERSIKPFVIDRKNFLFANTPKGATGSAIMFSLIQTAIENDLDPYRYLTWLLRTANTADLTDAQAVQNLLPWKVPAEYHVK